MMRRSFSDSGFVGSDFESEPDADPRVGLVNLADVMLVFACGLMLALVAYWNLDVSSMSEVIQSEEVTEVQDVEQIEEGASGGGGFIELGKVYQDPMTGKFYMLQDDMNKSGGQDDMSKSRGSEKTSGQDDMRNSNGPEKIPEKTSDAAVEGD